MRRRATTAALTALVGVALLADAAPAASLFGFNDTPATFAQQASSANRAGARIARVAVSWELAEPRANTYHWSETDAAVAALRAQGIRQLFVISAAPEWAAPGCLSGYVTCGVGAGHLPDYRDFVLALMQRYPGSKLQAWNEPNLGLFGAMTPARAAHLTRTAHQVAPGRVVAPAPAPADPAQWKYLEALRRGLPRSVPIGVHLYPRMPFAQRGLADYWRKAERVAGDRPIWVTEIGYAESQFGAAGQARLSVHALEYLDRAGARAVIFHRLRDQIYDWSAWLSSLGVINSDGTRKPAFRALRRAVAGLG